MTGENRIQKFSDIELMSLRNGVLQAGIDSWQAQQLVATFLAGRGYGVDAELVPQAVQRLEGGGCMIECMQEALERVALVM